MLALCPSAYGLTAVTKFGRDNIVVGGGEEREGGREREREGTKYEEFYKNLFTVLETNT